MKFLHTPNPDSREILASVRICDDLTPIDPATLPESVRLLIASSRLHGVHVVLAIWETGQYAILPCPLGSNMPAPEMVIAAYHQSTAQRQPSAKGGAR